MRHFSHFGLLMVGLLLTAPFLDAKVFTFEELNCRCEVPDTWAYQETYGDLVHVVDFTHTKSFELRTMAANRTITLDNKQFISGFDSATFSQGFTLQESGNTVLDGVKFHEIHLFKDLGNKTLQIRLYIALADGYGYSIEAETYNQDPTQDAEIKAMLQSFAFIKPPHVHVSFSFQDIFKSRDLSRTDSGYLLSYWSGFLIGILVVLSAILVVVVGITYGIQSMDRDDEETALHEGASSPVIPPSRRVAPPPEETTPVLILMGDGQQVVHEEREVREMLREGTLALETFYWMEGMPEWRPLQELPPPRSVTVAPPRRTGQESARSRLAATPIRTAASSGDELKPYRFRFIHKLRFLRLVAVLIDFTLLFGPIVFASFFATHDTTQARPNFALFVCLGFYLIILIVTQIVQVLRSRSIGKSVLGLRVVNLKSQAKSGFIANVGRLLTHGVFGMIPIVFFLRFPFYVMAVVILYAFIDAVFIFYRDRCLHDYISGTTIIRRER